MKGQYSEEDKILDLIQGDLGLDFCSALKLRISRNISWGCNEVMMVCCSELLQRRVGYQYDHF